MKTISGSDIIHAQKVLHLEPTGVYDPLTEAAVRNFQLKSNLPVTGQLDAMTRESMFMNESDLTTDLTERYSSFFQNYFLPEDEYVKSPTKKEYLFLHHTAGWNNPYRVVDMWATDTAGRIGTQYIIGGINPKTGDDSYDGVILKCFEDDYYAWHLGNVDRYMHKHSIGIELCNFGWLIKKNGNFYTYANTIVDPDQVVDLGFTFRGYRYWQRYSDKQIQMLRDLIMYITDKHGISTHSGLQQRLQHMAPNTALEYYDEAFHGEVKGILSHTSVRKDKFDIFPQENLVDMLLSL